jgi:hypothetical protein
VSLRKIILAPVEFETTQLGEFFSKIGFTFEQSVNLDDLSVYSFIVDDYLSEVENLPRLKTTFELKIDKNTRAFISKDELNESVLNLLERYFTDRDDLDLIDKYSREFKDILTVKIQDYLNIGYFTDLIVVEAYRAHFNISQIRSSINDTIDAIFKIAETKGSVLPIEISFSHDGQVFAVQASTVIDSFNYEIDYYRNEDLNNKLINESNFVDVTYLKSRNKLTITNLWFKENVNFKAYFFTQVEKRKYTKHNEHNIKIAEQSTVEKYLPDGQEGKRDQGHLTLARKIAIYIETHHRNNVEFLSEISLKNIRDELVNYPIQEEVDALNDDILIDVILIIKSRIEGNDQDSILEGTHDSGDKAVIVHENVEDNDTNDTFVVTESPEFKIRLLEEKLRISEEQFEKVLAQKNKTKTLLDKLVLEFNKLKIKIQNQQNQSENPERLIELEENEKKYKKQISEIDSLISNKDLKINLLEQKAEFFAKQLADYKVNVSPEKLNELDRENRNLRSKMEQMNQSLAIYVNNQSQKENDLVITKSKEIENLKSQIHFAQTLIQKFKSEKTELEVKHLAEMNQLKAAVFAESVAKPPEIEKSYEHESKRNLEKNLELLQEEKKILEEKSKYLSQENKKIENKLKLALRQIEDASKQKAKSEKSNVNSHDIYIKQIEASNKKLAETIAEMNERKKELIKQKQENTQQASKILELERKLANLEKKVA